MTEEKRKETEEAGKSREVKRIEKRSRRNFGAEKRRNNDQKIME
jgi:hypothetical protein